MIVNHKAIRRMLNENQRLDGRTMTEFRKNISIQPDIYETAEGSARVIIGETEVVAGVKLSLEKPFNDTPNQGGIVVNVELRPLSHPDYEGGPPSINAIEMARVIDRGIRESHAIDFKKLCIKPGEQAWFILIDLISINDAGNLYDASSLAVLSALKNTVLPAFNKELGVVDYKVKTKKGLPINKETITVTLGLIGDSILVDPTKGEEAVVDSRLSVAIDKTGKISALQKGGSVPLSQEKILDMVDLAIEKSLELRKLV